MCGLHQVAFRAASAACCVLINRALLVFTCLLRPSSVHCSVYVLCTVLCFCSFSGRLGVCDQQSAALADDITASSFAPVVWLVPGLLMLGVQLH